MAGGALAVWRARRLCWRSVATRWARSWARVRRRLGIIAPRSPRGGAGAQEAEKNDEDYAEDLQDLYAEGDREHLDRLADRNAQDGYDR